MRTKQSAEFEKQESTWIYLLHQQAPPQTRLSAEASLSLPPLDAPGPASAFAERQQATQPSRGLLLPPPPPPAMMLSSQDKAWTPNSLLTLSLPRLSDLGNSTPRDAKSPPSGLSSKRACFPKKCDFPMCKNSSRSRGFCYSHGGGRRCRVDGCSNGAVSRDLCKRHGGGRRCRVAGCKSSSESGGLCYSHGGGRRCSLTWCSARAKKGGFCAVHLTGDRSPPSSDISTDSGDATSSEKDSDVGNAAIATGSVNAEVHPNVVETLLSLAKDQSAEEEPKNAYAIASLLN
ncbi:hypothetical protein KRP22_012678 [Phytophthora ramorum]|nr:putative WRKY transcription factor 19 [Phytophthora ramorum]